MPSAIFGGAPPRQAHLPLGRRTRLRRLCRNRTPRGGPGNALVRRRYLPRGAPCPLERRSLAGRRRRLRRERGGPCTRRRRLCRNKTPRGGPGDARVRRRYLARGAPCPLGRRTGPKILGRGPLKVVLPNMNIRACMCPECLCSKANSFGKLVCIYARKSVPPPPATLRRCPRLPLRRCPPPRLVPQPAHEHIYMKFGVGTCMPTPHTTPRLPHSTCPHPACSHPACPPPTPHPACHTCLLYTTDAADDAVIG